MKHPDDINFKIVENNMTWEIKKNNRSLGLVNAKTPLMALDKLFKSDLVNNWDDIKYNYLMTVVDDIIVLEEL